MWLRYHRIKNVLHTYCCLHGICECIWPSSGSHMSMHEYALESLLIQHKSMMTSTSHIFRLVDWDSHSPYVDWRLLFCCFLFSSFLLYFRLEFFPRFSRNISWYRINMISSGYYTLYRTFYIDFFCVQHRRWCVCVHVVTAMLNTTCLCIQPKNASLLPWIVKIYHQALFAMW